MHHALVMFLALPDPAAVPEPPATPAGELSRPAASRPSRRLRIAGYVALGLGSGLLGMAGAAAVFHVKAVNRLEARGAALTPNERLEPGRRFLVQQQIDSARVDRNVAIITGVSAAVTLAAATTFFLLARDRRSRIAVAPSWLPSGAGLTLVLRLR